MIFKHQRMGTESTFFFMLCSTLYTVYHKKKEEEHIISRTRVKCSYFLSIIFMVGRFGEKQLDIHREYSIGPPFLWES